jgi:cyclohexa-1,5-dienecarbonyl-CoA hydratase
VTESLRLERDGRRAVLTVARPPLNILDLELLDALAARCDELAGDSELQVVEVRGEGEKAFSAGVSIHDHTPEKIERMLAAFHGALGRLRALDAFTVALVQGHCLGGGLELACACDLVLATESARFGLPEIQLGCFPPFAAALLPRRIGPGPTLELALTGRVLDAAEAAELGLVHQVVSPGALDAHAARLAESVLSRSAAASRAAKRAVRAGEERPLGEALTEAERIYLRELGASADMTEGIEAFLAKREPRWRHR